MNDLISRQAAIDAIHCDITVTGRQNAELVAATIGAFADRIKAPPSVTPKQKRGKWINGYCSECGKHAPFWAMASTYYKSSFCPNCGARMDEERMNT